MEQARARAADAGAELAAVNQFWCAAPAPPAAASPLLAGGLTVEPGFELALAAALGPRLRPRVVDSLAAGETLLDGGGRGRSDGSDRLARSRPAGRPAPAPGAERLLDHVNAEGDVAKLAERLLARRLGRRLARRRVRRASPAWPSRAPAASWTASTGELRQAPAGGEERLLEERGRRDGLVAASEAAVADEAAARAEAEGAGTAVTAADTAREEAEVALRRASRELDEAAELPSAPSG